MTTYHYVMTVQYPGYSTGTWNGTIDVEGATRSEVYDRLYGQVAAQIRRPPTATDGPNVLFWSLERNDLT